jgi:hypothetical protein
MNRLMKNTFAIAFLVLLSASVAADTTYSDRETLEFPKPSKPGLLRIVSGTGDITVEGYDGQKVIIETKSSVENVLNPPEDEKAKGMKRISGSGLSISSDKDGNAIVIRRSMRNETDLFIKVPFNTSLQFDGDTPRPVVRMPPAPPAPTAPPDVSFDRVGPDFNIDRILDGVDRILENVFYSLNITGGMLSGDISISNISGDIEVNTREGNISLNDVSGEVVAHSVDGELLVTFKEVTKEEPIAFSTIDGDIDVTFPSNIKATLSAKNVDGDIYTDFDIDITHLKDSDVRRNRRWRNGLTGMFGNTVTGNINGGGTEILISTVDGNIYIRKGK